MEISESFARELGLSNGEHPSTKAGSESSLNELLSLPERKYMVDLTARLLGDIETFEFSTTDKYALKAIMPRVSACVDLR